MNPVDGRLIAIGIVVGVVVGFGLMALTQETFWIYLGAGVGVILALSLKPKDKSDE